MLRILESFLLLVFGIGILCEQYTQYRNNVSKKNLFLFITAIILMICVEARYACEKQVQNNSPYTISSCKLCKSTNTGLIEHTSGERKFRTFPTAVQPFFFTTVIVFAPAVAFTASVLATYTAFIFGTNATRKTTKCNSFHYCAASHSAVNCLIVC